MRPARLGRPWGKAGRNQTTRRVIQLALVGQNYPGVDTGKGSQGPNGWAVVTPSGATRESRRARPCDGSHPGDPVGFTYVSFAALGRGFVKYPSTFT